MAVTVIKKTLAACQAKATVTLGLGKELAALKTGPALLFPPTKTCPAVVVMPAAAAKKRKNVFMGNLLEKVISEEGQSFRIDPLRIDLCSHLPAWIQVA
jgi:hypothetical protein